MNLGLHDLLPETFATGLRDFDLAGEAFRLNDVSIEGKQEAGGHVRAVTGDEGSTVGNQFVEDCLRVGDLRVSDDENREIFKRNASLLFANIDDQLLVFDAEPGRLFGDF
jgi:hypothetical protein